MDAVPVLIAGAGPVGLALALGLARRGVRSVVLERKRALDPNSRATLIVPRTLEILEGSGVLPAFLAEGQRNDAIRLLRAPGREPLLTFDFAPLGDRTPTPFVLALSQDRTERLLLDAVRATGLVEVRLGEALEGFEAREDHVRVRAEGGREWRAGWLVGTDGAHSAVRRRLGLPLDGKTFPGRAALADVEVEPAFDAGGAWLVDPEAPAFTVAVRFGDGTWRLIESAIPDDVADQDLPARARALAERLFGAGAWRRTLWTAAYRKHERRVERYVQGRVALAGDAAHLNSPAGGQGMNAGLQDAHALAAALAEAVARPEAADAALAHYERERMAAFDRVRQLSSGLERMETAPRWLRGWTIAGLRLLRRAGIEALVARRLSMLPGHRP